MHVFMMTYDDVIDKQKFTCNASLRTYWPTETYFGGWVEQTVADIFINKSIDEWRQRLEAVVKNNGGHIEHLFK